MHYKKKTKQWPILFITLFLNICQADEPSMEGVLQSLVTVEKILEKAN